MAIVKTGIGRSKRDLLKKLIRLRKFVDTRKGDFTAKDKVVFKKAIVNMSLAYKLLDKIECVQEEMSIPFGYYEGAARASRRGRPSR